MARRLALVQPARIAGGTPAGVCMNRDVRRGSGRAAVGVKTMPHEVRPSAQVRDESRLALRLLKT
jgi:hypothetical protein